MRPFPPFALSILLVLAAQLNACQDATPTPAEERPVSDLPAIKATHEKERIPPRDPEADQL